ncbi:MAG: sigma-54-dependent Fis family transcriptional regulator [Syntrophobacteraceae bacterium]|nr:sigma-54-dependent Fis family transcriptional regulator [Syntrophobacteraceae bacterium]
MEFSPAILVVDDDPVTLQLIGEGLQEEGLNVEPDLSGAEAIEKSGKSGYDIVITDLVMPGVDGMKVLDHFTAGFPDTIVILLTGHGTIETAVQAVKRGAFDYLTKPVKLDEILLVIQRASEMKSLRTENVLLRSQLQDRYRYDRIIGQSAPMQALYRTIQRVAKADSTVLLMGESGTGKELIANAIHFNSDRRDKPLVPINCGAIPEELLESELFGHEKGAFTGAIKERKGRFELAHQGTVFLDEIGEMSQKLQVKLLRFLQEKKFERIGGTRTIQVDVGIIAATNKDLEKAVAAGEFREDLYYRLNVIPIRVPPLRERDGDVPLLVRHFLKRHCEEKEIPMKRFSRATAIALDQYTWPGNVRELENLIERLVILTDSDEIGIEDLPPRFRQQQYRKPPSRPFLELTEEGIDLKKTLDELEDRLILDALKMAGGVKNKAAQLLGLNRTTLIEKMKKKRIHHLA